MSAFYPLAMPKPAPEPKLTAYSFPSIGDGMTIWAASFEEAQEKAQKILADLKKHNS